MIEIIDQYLSEASQAYDLFSMKADAVMESAIREVGINHAEAELKVMQEHGTYEDLAYYYEEAKNGLVESVVNTIQRIKEAIIKFFSAMKDKILTVMGKKENREAIAKIEKKVKLFPLLGKKKILVEDYDAHLKNSEKTLSQLAKLKAKLKSGHDVDPEQIHDIKKSFLEEHSTLIGVSAAITITVAAGLTVIHKMTDKSGPTLNKLEKTATDACNECIEIAKKCDNPAVAHILAETITTVSKTAQEDYVRSYSGVVSAIKKSIKSFGKTKVDVAKAEEVLKGVNEGTDNPETLMDPKEMNKAEETLNKNVDEGGNDPIDDVPAVEDEPDTDPWDDVMSSVSGLDEDDVTDFDKAFNEFCENMGLPTNESSSDKKSDDITDIFANIMEEVTSESSDDEDDKNVTESAYEQLMSEIDSLL